MDNRERILNFLGKRDSQLATCDSGITESDIWDCVSKLHVSLDEVLNAIEDF